MKIRSPVDRGRVTPIRLASRPMAGSKSTGKSTWVAQLVAGAGRLRITVPLQRTHARRWIYFVPWLADFTYGSIDTMACASLAGRWRVVTVIHSPGFTALTAADAACGARNLKVM